MYGWSPPQAHGAPAQLPDEGLAMMHFAALKIRLPQMLVTAGLELALAVVFASPLAAKTLVYCSEGSPENFNPQLNTTGTSFDAALPVYNELVEFERGGTKIVPGLAKSWTISRRWPHLHLQSPRRREAAQQRQLQAHAQL
jgi:hypothetical protein